MSGERMTRAEAIRRGLDEFLPVNPCHRGHTTARRVIVHGSVCCECRRAYLASYYEAKLRERRRVSRAAQRLKISRPVETNE